MNYVPKSRINMVLYARRNIEASDSLKSGIWTLGDTWALL